MPIAIQVSPIRVSIEPRNILANIINFDTAILVFTNLSWLLTIIAELYTLKMNEHNELACSSRIV